MLPEITRPVDLCLPSGALNPAATGWSRRALHRANLHPAPLGSRAATWSRTKRREHWGIVTDTHLVTVTVNSLNYAAQHQVWILDREREEVIVQSAIVPLARQVELPETPGAGPVRALTRDLAIAADPDGGVTRLRVKTPRVRADLYIDAGSECLGVVIPWSDRQFQYTLKASGVAVHGRLEIDGTDVEIGPQALATVDHGRGRWPYATTYASGAATGWLDGQRVGLHLGGLWADGTGAAENALLVDGRMHYLAEELQWEYDVEDPQSSWRVNGERVVAELRPFHHDTTSTNLGIVATTSTQVAGDWHGWVVDDDGAHRSLEGVTGWAEVTSNRW